MPLSGLRPTIAGSPNHPAETDSLSYGLRIRFQLLSPPSPLAEAQVPPPRSLTTQLLSTSRGMAPRGGDSHPADKTSSRTHDCFASLAMTDVALGERTRVS